MRKPLALSLIALVSSCGGDGSKTDLPYEKIEIHTELTVLPLGQSSAVSVIGIKTGGAKEPVVTGVFSLSPQVVEVVTAADGSLTLFGRSVGTTTLQAVFGPNFELVAELSFEVRAPELVSLSLQGTRTATASPRLAVGTQTQLALHATYSDGASRVITDAVTFKSSDDSIASVSDSGLVTSKTIGTITVTAEFESQSASAEVEVYCSYVSATDSLVVGQLSPNMRWDGAFRENDVMVDFSMEKFHCSPEFARYTTVNFVIGTGWCPYCPEFMRYVDSISSELDAAGGLIVYVEAQNDAQDPATNVEANSIVKRYIENGIGLRVGDGDTLPSAKTIARSVAAYPSAIVVRRRDLKTIAYQRGGNTGFDFVGFAQDPELTGFTNNCADGDEEASEPNDSVDKAAPLATGDNLGAGICNDAPDFYQINHEGAWRLIVEFDHNVGDLDAFVWDTMNNTPHKDAAGNRVGSATSSSNEFFEHSGPAVVRISGFRGASAPYRIKLVAN